MPPRIHHLLDDALRCGGERIATLFESASLRIERIASNGAASPSGFWYDQDTSEWVALVRGDATLEFGDGSVTLAAGDALLIPAHLEHRVTRTSPDAMWLAVHFSGDAGLSETGQ